MIKKLLPVFTTQDFTYIFTNFFTHILSKRQKFITFYKYSFSRLLLLLPSTLIDSGVTGSRLHPVFILNAMLFFIPITYIFIEEFF